VPDAEFLLEPYGVGEGRDAYPVGWIPAERVSGSEIELVNDGDGAAIFGDQTAVERFLATSPVPSRAIALRPAVGSALSAWAGVAQALRGYVRSVIAGAGLKRPHKTAWPLTESDRPPPE
jgi:hypothetical protein